MAFGHLRSKGLWRNYHPRQQNDGSPQFEKRSVGPLASKQVVLHSLPGLHGSGLEAAKVFGNFFFDDGGAPNYCRNSNKENEATKRVTTPLPNFSMK
jgi:hypothetical protein